MFGAGLAFAPDGSPRQIDVARGEAAQLLARLGSRVRNLHPVLKDVRVVSRWGGPVAFREGRRPLLARLPQDPRVIVTGAYAGHGVALSVRAGLLAAAAIAAGEPLPAWGAPNSGS